MKFMMLVKHSENSGIPPQELMEAIGKLSEEAGKADTMIASGGLAPRHRARAYGFPADSSR